MNLKGFVESQGAQVVGATVLTGKAYSARLKLEEETLKALRTKYGIELEQWLQAQKEIDERLDRSPRLKSLIERMRRAATAIESGIESV